MGSDLRIVRAARASYNMDGQKESVEEQKTLIRYLLRNKHTTPFEMCEIVFHLTMPVYVARQLVRHRTASINEQSGRYVELSDEFAETEPNEWRLQSTDNKQGSSGLVDPATGAELTKMQKKIQKACYSFYELALSFGVAKEQARCDLPVSYQTMMYWKVDLWNLMNFLRLRLDSHAQKEIRDLANPIYEKARELFPIAMEAFDDYIKEAYTLSAMEVVVIRDLLRIGEFHHHSLEWWLDLFPSKMSKREREAFLAKFTDY